MWLYRCRPTIGLVVRRNVRVECWKRSYARGKGHLSEQEIRSSFNERNELMQKGLSEIDVNDKLYPLIDKVRNVDVNVVRIPDVRKKWDNEFTNHSDSIPSTDLIQVNGRIRSIRRSGKKLLFIDLVQDFTSVQVVVNCNKIDGFKEDVDLFVSSHQLLRRGDIISSIGRPWRTKSGEFSLLANEGVKLLSPCLHPLPVNELNDTTRLHNRVVDLSINDNAKNILLARSTILSTIREYFLEKRFIEVQTPILSVQSGGATAKPFLTESRELDDENIKLSMRIAPELWLKRLVISGFDKIFEIGQCFRNEGIDSTHNPEFTSCEFYQSYTNLDELIEITREVFYKVIVAVRSKHSNLQSKDILDKLENEFHKETPIRKIDFISEIEKLTGKSLPIDLNNREELIDYYHTNNIPIPQSSTPLTSSKLLDNLASIFIEPQCKSPTFIMNHPYVMSPLAKSSIANINGIDRKISRRFELFINSKEYVNAYEEENNPFLQKENFSRQAYDNLTLKDSETPLPDDSYISAMEWGLPPTGGWGMGIDRLCMLLTGADRISQVLTFGSVKTVNYQ